MRPTLVSGFVALAFVTGFAASRWTAPAEAQSGPPPLRPQIVNLLALTDDEIGKPAPAPNTDLRSKTLAVTEHGTLAVQTGNVIKHFHADANEFQLILAGSGSFWLDDKEVQVKPGDLVVIPKGTHHAGSKASEGRFKALAIKMPPQRPDDVHPVN
ncbi:MAG: cupin domain-containing protein [Methylobacteriaceae bacterium]|nr:cupin domain-containing protein [Methylobacteriaceae bacterium]